MRSPRMKAGRSSDATSTDEVVCARYLGKLANWSQARGNLVAVAPEVESYLLEAELLPLTASDRSAARELQVEFSSRISVAALRYRDGNEAAALDSLYKIFLFTRDLAKRHGSDAFEVLARAILEEVMRPFTGRWHGRNVAGGLESQDDRRLFRQELRVLQVRLLACVEVLGAMAEPPVPTRPQTKAGPRLDTQTLWPQDYLGSVPAQPAQLGDELAFVAARRRAAYTNESECSSGGLGTGEGGSTMGLVGLALSGGGIRSATFCLGVLQSLQRHGILQDVDYLSTVSGGGYIGTFLSNSLWAARGNDPYEQVLDKILACPEGRTGDTHAVRWLRNNSKYLWNGTFREKLGDIGQLAKGLLPWGQPMHHYYRKRLSSAYLDDRTGDGSEPPRLSELLGVGNGAPYHLFNAAVNLPGSREIELRGRRSDFFLLSPHWTGSVVTGYCRTQKIEEILREHGENCDLSTFMAISGAALAPQRGVKKVGLAKRAMMVAMNVRLGRWLPNPGRLAQKVTTGRSTLMGSRWRELWGNFAEGEDFVNVSDGGHIENLGLYELLRRRCKFIISVDGECDPEQSLQALSHVTRLAAIDFGVKIEMDGSDLVNDQKMLSRTHWAFGTIDYGSNGQGGRELGYLLYIKSSLTGNEPTYVDLYRKQHPTFPHESTLDQLFNEDQFEAYRALGEHAADDLFGEDLITASELKAKSCRARRWLESLVGELL